MKRLFLLTAVCLSLAGCAVGVIAGAGAMDGANRAEMQKMACLTRYGFLPALEYGWANSTNPTTGASVMESVLSRAYVQRVSPGSYAAQSGIREGDLILAVNGVNIVDNTALETMSESNGDKFSRLTLKNGSGQVYSVDFNTSR